MSATAPASTLRQDLQRRLGGWLDELEPAIRAYASSAVRDARAELGDALNQAVRRLRQASDAGERYATLADAACSFCGRAAILRVENDRAIGECIRGVDGPAAERFVALDFPLDDAPALAGAVATRDPVTAVATPGELSAALAEIASGAGPARASTFPILTGGRVAALLCCWGEVQAGPVELLAQAAGLAVADAPQPEKEPGLISLAPLPAPPATTETPPAEPPRPWDDLSPEQQRTHLRAQRFARVQVSEIRLFQAEAVHAGRVHKDLYGALADAIDSARLKFKSSFLTACPGMIDYFHLELVRTLANDNPALLGPDYPGPLA
jgi:hypothetical protein